MSQKGGRGAEKGGAMTSGTRRKRFDEASSKMMKLYEHKNALRKEWQRKQDTVEELHRDTHALVKSVIEHCKQDYVPEYIDPTTNRTLLSQAVIGFGLTVATERKICRDVEQALQSHFNPFVVYASIEAGYLNVNVGF